jgi:hypothetical protein
MAVATATIAMAAGITIATAEIRQDDVKGAGTSFPRLYSCPAKW